MPADDEIVTPDAGQGKATQEHDVVRRRLNDLSGRVNLLDRALTRLTGQVRRAEQSFRTTGELLSLLEQRVERLETDDD